MKTSLLAPVFAGSRRCALLTCTVLCLTVRVVASPDAGVDRGALAEELLASHGSVAVKRAGPYVQVGTPRIAVSTKLGTPTRVWPDGTWLYRGFQVTDSGAVGFLRVQFDFRGAVSDLQLMSPAAVRLAEAQARARTVGTRDVAAKE